MKIAEVHALLKKYEEVTARLVEEADFDAIAFGRLGYWVDWSKLTKQ